jgi:hypothetical protein
MITLLALRFGRQVREFKIAPIWFGVSLLAYVIGGKNGLSIILPISLLPANIPQIWVAYKESNLADLSLGTWFLSLTDGLVWEVYALIQQGMTIAISAFFQLTTSGLIVALKLANKWKIQKQGRLPQSAEPWSK